MSAPPVPPPPSSTEGEAAAAAPIVASEFDRTALVTNIAAVLEELHLQALFAGCGTIERILIERVEGDRRQAFVVFTSAEAINSALLFDDTLISDRKLAVQPHPESATKKQMDQDGNTVSSAVVEEALREREKAQEFDVARGASLHQSNQGAEVSRTIYVGNLSPQLTEQHLRTFFSRVGDVLYIKIIGTPVQTSRYAFIEFAAQESANAAQALNGHALQDSYLKVGPAQNPIIKITTPMKHVDPEKAREASSKALDALASLEARFRSGGGAAAPMAPPSHSAAATTPLPDAAARLDGSDSRSSRPRSHSRDRRSRDDSRDGDRRSSRSRDDRDSDRSRYRSSDRDRDRDHRRRRSPSPRDRSPARRSRDYDRNRRDDDRRGDRYDRRGRDYDQRRPYRTRDAGAIAAMERVARDKHGNPVAKSSGTGLLWDGFQWVPEAELNRPKTEMTPEEAALIAQRLASQPPSVPGFTGAF